MSWLSLSNKESGVMALQLDAEEFGLVHSNHVTGARAQVTQYAVRPFDVKQGADLGRIAKSLKLRRYRCVTVLQPGEYQMLLVEAPKVAPEEIKAAIRWHVKDLLDLPVEEVTLDVLDIPVLRDDVLAGHYMYVVSASNKIIEQRMNTFSDAKIALDAIDIPETAQRNISALYAEPDFAVAMLHMGPLGALLTITYRSELYMARKIEISMAEFTENFPSDLPEVRARVGVEVQRSLDHFERQYHSIMVKTLLMAPEPSDTGLADYMADNLAIVVKSVNLSEVMELPNGADAPAVQWRLFHLIGASLRQASS